MISVNGISKRYPGVTALDNVSISFAKGEIHALMGENGAGKSTLIKIMAGAETADSGTIEIGRQSFSHMRPQDAQGVGISVIYQDFNLAPSLSVAENIFMGKQVGTSRFLPDFKEMGRLASEVLKGLGSSLKPETLVFELSTSQQQLVEIAKAIASNCKVLIMDEPSAAIAVAEVENMFRLVRELKAKGVTVIYISHRIDEVFGLCDRVSVLRDGKFIATEPVDGLARKDLISLMVGRELKETYPPHGSQIGEVLLSANDVTGNGDFHVDLSVRKGEILGMAGLVGAGRTEFARSISQNLF